MSLQFILQTIFGGLVTLAIAVIMRQLNQVHVLVNSKMTEALSHIARLEQQLIEHDINPNPDEDKS